MKITLLIFGIISISVSGIAQGNGQQNGNGNAQWKTTGNDIADTTKFIGTTNQRPIVFKSNNVERFRLTPEGDFGIGTSTPQAKLDVNGSVIFRSNMTLTDPPVSANPFQLNILGIDQGGIVSTFGMENLIEVLYGPCDLAFPGGSPGLPHWTSEPGKIYANCDVNVGINTDNPLYKLDCRGTGAFQTGIRLGWNSSPNIPAYIEGYNASIQTTKPWIRMSIDENSTTKTVFQVNYDGGLQINQFNTTNYSKLLYLNFTNPTTEIIKAVNTQTNQVAFLLEGNGKMTINNGTEKILQLEADGLLRARKIKVDTEVWPDYVFSPDYVLMPLLEVEEYLTKEKHLPNIPSENEILENGLDLGKMDVLLLEKIEELMLYTIEQQKEIEMLKMEINTMKQK